MSAKDDFQFLNSPIWLKYTQESYKTPEEMKYRLDQVGVAIAEWDEIQTKILRHRKTAAIPLFLPSIDKKFWFYPADSILKKAHDIEKLGLRLSEKINNESVFASNFKLDAAMEEAVSSAIYEGANSTRAQARTLLESRTSPKNKDEWMLVNNLKALLWIKKHHTQPITVDLISEVHAIVTKNTLVADDINFAGRLRNDKVFVYSSSGEMRHEGVTHTLLELALSEAIELVTNNPRYFPALLKGILLHYFISFIHPYFDGNGRTARSMFYYKAIKNELKFMELLSVSAYLKNHGKQYELSFEKVVRNDFDITYFLDFNLDALEEALRKVERKVDLLLSVNKLENTLGLSPSQIGLLQKLMLHKFRTYDIETYARSIDRSREVARQELKQLADLDLLEEKREGKKFVYRILRKNLLEKLESGPQ